MEVENEVRRCLSSLSVEGPIIVKTDWELGSVKLGALLLQLACCCYHGVLLTDTEIDPSYL